MMTNDPCYSTHLILCTLYYDNNICDHLITRMLCRSTGDTGPLMHHNNYNTSNNNNNRNMNNEMPRQDYIFSWSLLRDYLLEQDGTLLVAHTGAASEGVLEAIK